MGNIRGGSGFWRWGGLRPLPPLLIAKVKFSTFGKMEQFNGKMEQFEIKWRKCISMSKHISLFSPLFIWSYLRFLVSLQPQSLKINSYEKSTLCYSGIVNKTGGRKSENGHDTVYLIQRFQRGRNRMVGGTGSVRNKSK